MVGAVLGTQAPPPGPGKRPSCGSVRLPGPRPPRPVQALSTWTPRPPGPLGASVSAVCPSVGPAGWRRPHARPPGAALTRVQATATRGIKAPPPPHPPHSGHCLGEEPGHVEGTRRHAGTRVPRPSVHPSVRAAWPCTCWLWCQHRPGSRPAGPEGQRVSRSPSASVAGRRRDAASGLTGTRLGHWPPRSGRQSLRERLSFQQLRPEVFIKDANGIRY